MKTIFETHFAHGLTSVGLVIIIVGIVIVLVVSLIVLLPGARRK
jgi:hypothetical protein